MQSIREQIEKRFSPREKVSTSVDLPLSWECKRVLTFGAEEAKRRNHAHITPEHFLLGLLREQDCAAAKIMLDNGLTASQVEENALDFSPANTPSAAAAVVPLLEGSRDLTAEARSGSLNPLIGRGQELDRIVRILSRRSRNSAVLIGEPGVGKNTLVQGLAQRIADGVVPQNLAERTIVAIDASSLLSSESGGKLASIRERPNVILYVQGLFDLATKGTGWGVLEAIRVLEPHILGSHFPGSHHGQGLQTIATGTPLRLRLTLERAESLVRRFEVVPVLPPEEEETIRIVSGLKQEFEKFHGVAITDEAVETAVSASRWFLRHRQLPDRAIDLIDEAAARVKVRNESEPRDVVEIRKRLRMIVREMENAIANHAFEKAREWSGLERKERQNLHRLSQELKPRPQGNVVSAEDIVESVADRAGVAVSAVKNVLEVRPVEQLELVAKELAAKIPIGGTEWAERLTNYLAGCSAGEADDLAAAIRAAKAKIDAGS